MGRALSPCPVIRLGRRNNHIRSSGQYPYTTAPHSTPSSVPAPHSNHAQVASASPRHISPYAATSANNGSQPQTSVHTQTPQQHPMAAPAPPSQTPNAQQSVGKMNPPAPLSPGAQSRERDRVTLLLDINRVLLQEVLKLQEQGKTGPLPQPGQNPDEAGGKEGEPKASQEYIQSVSNSAIAVASHLF